MDFCELSENEFSSFEKNSPFGNMLQTVERAKLREKMGFKCYFLGVKSGKNVVAAGLLVEKNGEGWIQVGPILDWNNNKLIEFFVRKTTEFAQANKLLVLEIFPPVVLRTWNPHGEKLSENKCNRIFRVFSDLGFSHMGFTKKMEYKAFRWVFVKDLSQFKDLKEIELSFNSDKRKQFHRTQRNLDVVQVTEKSELKNWILPLNESDKRNGLHTRDLGYFEDIWDAFGDKAMFLEARLKETGEIVASEVDIWHKNELVTFLSGMTEKYRNKNGMTAIKGWQMEECLRRGVKRLNMYGIEGSFSGNTPLLKTKSEFGGVVEEYIGGFKIVLSPWKYFWNKVKKRLFK